MEPGSHDETYLEIVCQIRISFDSLGVGSFIEGEEFLTNKYSPKVLLDLEEITQVKRGCKRAYKV